MHKVDGETGRFPVCNVQSVSLVKATLKARESKRLFVFCILLHPINFMKKILTTRGTCTHALGMFFILDCVVLKYCME